MGTEIVVDRVKCDGQEVFDRDVGREAIEGRGKAEGKVCLIKKGNGNNAWRAMRGSETSTVYGG